LEHKSPIAGCRNLQATGQLPAGAGGEGGRPDGSLAVTGELPRVAGQSAEPPARWPGRRRCNPPSCMEGGDFRRGSQPALDSLRGAPFKRKGIHLVDGSKWRADDEQLEDHVACGEFQDADLERAFAHALISFSRVQFSSNGRLALMKKNPSGWEVSK